MSEPLRGLMDRLAEDQPPVAVDPSLYMRGRRAHRRGVALRSGAAAALVVVAGLAAVPALDLSERPTTPAVGERSPAMPSELHPVPERLAPLHEDGHTWHRGLRADGLAIGTTAAVFAVNGGAVVAVSALDGEYRGLELPGFDEGSYVTFEDTPVALSPDGTRLAWGWNPHIGFGINATEAQTGVRVADLDTGEVTDVVIPSRLGVATHGFGWSPDGRYLAYGVRVVTEADEDTYATGRYRVERLDTTTGERIETPLRNVDTAPAVSDDGTVAVAGHGTYETWSPDDRGTSRARGPFDSVAWAPSGARTALASDAGAIAVGDEQGVRRETTSPSRRDGRTRVIGWPDDTGFVVVDERTSTLDLVSEDLEERRTLVEADDVADLYQLSVAIDLLEEPTRDTAAPDWPTDWGAVALIGGLLGAGLLVIAGLVVVLRRPFERDTAGSQPPGD